MDKTTVKVSKRYQIAIPSLARRKLRIQAGDRLLVDIQDGLLILIPLTDDYVEHMAGLHGDIWRRINSAAYLEQERDAWRESTND